MFTVAAAPAKVILEFDGDATHTLAVFGDPLPPPAPKNGTHAVVFGPGVHDIGQGYEVPAGMTVHIAGGAWVRGTLSGHRATNAVIEGRGVLSGERLKHPPKATDELAMLNLCGSHITVRGIHIVNPPTYMVNINPYLLRQIFLLILSPFRSTDIFDGAGTGRVASAAERWWIT